MGREIGNTLRRQSYSQSERDEARNTLACNGYVSALLEIADEVKKEKYNRRFGQKLDYRKGLQDYLGNNIGAVFSTSSHHTIRILPELGDIWEQIKSLRTAGECSRRVEELLKDYMRLNGGELWTCIRLTKEKYDDDDLERIWYATTKNGIDLHPGLVNEEDPEAVTLGDDCVHALLAGRTGSGKSVALHALIVGLMYKYAPWELNINLADFKIVEMSKYASGEKAAPHVAKIAATDSMEYVVSIMYDMYEKMDIRQKVFAKLGIQKLADFRDRFDVVLPREILIVDEFQQMFELATPKQAEIISQLIKMITKLGRATGFHLLFASQSMTGTVKGDVLANFKLRMCLSASEEISSMVLGNKEAADRLVNEKSRGYLLTNSEGGIREYNKEFVVPWVKSGQEQQDEDVWDRTLEKVIEENAYLADLLEDKAGYHKKNLDFYREEVIRPLWGKEPADKAFEADAERFYANTREAVRRSEEIDDYLLLGDSCVFAKQNGKESALEYTPLRNGERKNILCIGDSVYHRAYLMELLGIQYRLREQSEDPKKWSNFIVHGDSVVKDLVPVKEFKLKEGTPDQITDSFVLNYNRRSMLQTFASAVFDKNEEEKQMSKQQLIDILQINIQDAKTKTEADILWAMYQKGLNEDGKFRFKNLMPLTYWVNGYHMLGDLMESWRKKGVFDMFKKCTSLGMRVIFFGTRVQDLPTELLKSFEYRFLITNDGANFEKLEMKRPKEYRENTVWFQAKNETLNRQKPSLYILEQDQKLVKMFDVDQKENGALELDFFAGIDG